MTSISNVFRMYNDLISEINSTVQAYCLSTYRMAFGCQEYIYFPTTNRTTMEKFFEEVMKESSGRDICLGDLNARHVRRDEMTDPPGRALVHAIQ